MLSPKSNNSMPAENIRKAESRRSNKPLMEKRRRARINNCLNELKTLVLDAMKKDPARHNKLEKADILEMTVKYLQNLHRQQVAFSIATDPSVVNKYCAGFNECATEVNRYVSRMEGVDMSMKQRLVSHLSNCINRSVLTSSSVNSMSQLNIPIGIDIKNNSFSNIQLIPTQLANGDIAFIFPNSKNCMPTKNSEPMSERLYYSLNNTAGDAKLSYSADCNECHGEMPLELTVNRYRRGSSVSPTNSLGSLESRPDSLSPSNFSQKMEVLVDGMEKCASKNTHSSKTFDQDHWRPW